MTTRSLRLLDEKVFLDSAGVATTAVTYATGHVIYSQGGVCETVMFIQKGDVKLSVLSNTGKEAIVAVLGAGSFFGEGALAGQPCRMGSATAESPSTVLAIDKANMRRLLHDEDALADRFIAHLLARHVRIEEDLVEQLVDSTEKRLACALLLLARYGGDEKPQRVIPIVSHETLAEMAGTTRSRVDVLMDSFTKLGFIAVGDGLTIHSSLLSVVLHD